MSEPITTTPGANPTPSKTWSELIRCPECKADQWATVEQEYEMPFPAYIHTCQHCGHVILESEWNKVSESIKRPTFDALLPEEGTGELEKANARVKELERELAKWDESQVEVERARQRRDIEIMSSVRVPLEARIAELEAELADAIKAIKAQAELMAEANTRAERQTRRAESYARTAQVCLRDAGPALVEARERAEKAEGLLLWGCASCGKLKGAVDTAWRWNGSAWEHQCGDPQAGYFAGRIIEPGAVKDEFANLRAEIDRAIEDGIADTEEEKGRRIAAEDERDRFKAFTGKLWERLNGRRCYLIERNIKGRASGAERLELEELQALADGYIRIEAPIPEALNPDAAQEGK